MASRLLSSSHTTNWHRLYPSRRFYSLKPTTLSSISSPPKTGIDQDHHYTPSTATTSTPPPSSQTPDLHIRQVSSQARTLPDGTIPAEVTAIPSTISESPEPDVEAINAEVFHSRRARALGNATTSKTPVDTSSGVNTPDFTSTSSTVQSTSSKVMDGLKTNNTHKPFTMSASPVPSSRIDRLFHYGSLAAGMTLGAISESVKRATSSDSSSSSSNGGGGGLVLNPQNIERLVKTLSKMRGAALKLGQMLSFQDSNFLPPPIQTILSRVQNQADYMPPSQRDSVLSSNLGPNWRSLFSTFSEHPIAAASIGQVHVGTLASTGQKVAIKIQYPGVATSISSDLNNLSILLTATRLLPKGLYLDKTIANARTELAWECDYLREAASQTRFDQIIASDPSYSSIFSVPAVIPEASGPQVLTMEFMPGTPIPQLQNLTQSQRDFLGTQILRLCLLEIITWNFMQTDPNWSNFLFSPNTSKISLLDFGASREYPKEFITNYVNILKAARIKDTPTIRDLSIKLGYLTGLESQSMLEAHIGSILTLAEPFAETAPEIYDFGNQTVTERVKGYIPTMVRERLRPPPEETYSLHRKLSGAFLLCARLGSRVKARGMFEEIAEK